jgi:TPR repeat protein
MRLKVLLFLLFSTSLVNISYSLSLSPAFQKGYEEAQDRRRRHERENLEVEILRLKLQQLQQTQRVQQNPVNTDSLYNTALQGDAVAQFNLGSRFYNSKNYKEAVKWWRKSARKGLATSQTNLGYMYAHGLGVEKDMFTAKLWTEKGKEQGDAQAQTNWNALELWKY